jgi:hypothetical protein
MKRNILFVFLFLAAAFTNLGYAQGCMDDDGGEDGVKVFGFFQPEVNYLIADRDGFLGEDNQAGFYFNRARLGVMGNIPYDFSYYFVTEFSPRVNQQFSNAATICDAFITYKRFAPYFKVSVGQFKTQISAEQLHACHKLLTINRSKPVEKIAGPIRDMGIMFSGTTDTLLGVKDLFGYTLGIMNGTGRNLFDNNLQKDFTARLTIKPLDFLTIGGNYRYGKQLIEQEGSAPLEGSRSTIGVDLTFNYGNFFIQGEYLMANNEGTITTGGGCSGDPVQIIEAKDDNGFYLQAAYMTPWRLQPVVKFETYDPDIDAEATGNLYVENIMTFGLNYFFNDWTRVQLNYLYKAEENGSVEYPNDELLLQFQLVF